MSWIQFLYLMLAGAAATGGQFFITAAYRKAPAKEIAVFDYAQVLFAAILGYFILSQPVKPLSILGYVIIIGAAIGKWVYTLIRAKRTQKATAETDEKIQNDSR